MVVDYLRRDGNVSMIGLWGRSMGAVTRFVILMCLFYPVMKARDFSQTRTC